MSQDKMIKAKSEERKASLIALAIIVLTVVVAVGFFVIDTVKQSRYERLLEDVPENSVMLPSGVSLPKDDNLEDTVINIIMSDDYSKKEKKQVIELMALQGIDTTKMVETYNGKFKGKDLDNSDLPVKKEDTTNDGVNDNYEILEKAPVIDFLKNNNLVTDDAVEVTDKSESGLNMIGGKAARSYRNLYEAEKAFGTRLGLFFKVGSLENYEMVAAYTVGDDFLQCVYAANQDGTPIEDGQDIESTPIKTITVKLSTKHKSEELKKVYKEYELYSTEKLSTVEEFDVNFYGTEDKINLISFDLDNGRSYVIHSAEGIKIEIARALVYELDDGLTYVDDIVYEEPTYNE